VPGARAAEVTARFLDRHRVAVFALFTIFFFVPTAIRAAAKPFWHDEIYTILLAGLPSISNHWAAVRDGADLAPPLNAFLTRGVKVLAGVGPVVTRLPAMVGFWIMTLVVFVMVRRRANASFALAAACIPLFTSAYRYSYEARPYGVMMGLASLSWWAWAEAARGYRRDRYLPVLGLSLAAGLWNHYYAVLAYAPIVSGEVVRSIRRRRIDFGVGVTLAGSLAAAVPLLPLIRVSSAQAPNFWVRPSAADISGTYSFLFEALTAAEFRWTIAVIAVLIAVASFRPAQARAVFVRLPAHEIAAGMTCLLLPALGVLLGVLVTGVFVPRYALPAVAGMSIALPLTIDRLGWRARAGELVLLAALVGTYLGTLPSLRSIGRFENPVTARPLLAGALRMPGPTVASGQLWYLQLWYYAPLELKSRILYLADPDSGLRYRGSDVLDRGYLALARWTAVTVEPFGSFTRSHPRFRVYASGSGWLLDRLRDEHAEISETGTEPAGQLYEVSLKPQ
jgi:Dolichyl-phosphate-mannose-protein mannosyltransferase